jgi:hypothetical protein
MSYFSYQKGDRWWVRATVITVAILNYSFTGYLICEWRRLAHTPHAISFSGADTQLI